MVLKAYLSPSVNSPIVRIQRVIWDHLLAMESQMVQNSRNKIGLTFNKIVIKVKTDFNQGQDI